MLDIRHKMIYLILSIPKSFLSWFKTNSFSVYPNRSNSNNLTSKILRLKSNVSDLISKNNPISNLNLIRDNRMRHSRINLFSYFGAHFFQQLCTFLHTAYGDMEVGVAGSDKDWCSGEISLVVLLIDFIADQATGEGYSSPVALSIACYILKCQAGAL